jgi:hypothetical protein
VAPMPGTANLTAVPCTVTPLAGRPRRPGDAVENGRQLGLEILTTVRRSRPGLQVPCQLPVRPCCARAGI